VERLIYISATTMAFNTVKVLMTKSPPTEQGPNYDGPEYSITVLQKGHIRKPGYAPFQVDTIYEKDIKIVLRDGKTIRADIFRPAIPGAKIPVLMAWSPYGKTGRGV
jgi:predicted acyl esterase